MRVQEIIDLCVKEDIAIGFKYDKGRLALLEETKNHKGCGIGMLNRDATRITIYPPSECSVPLDQEDGRPTPNYLL